MGDGFFEFETFEVFKIIKEGDDDIIFFFEFDLFGDEENFEEVLEIELMVDIEVEVEERVSKKKKFIIVFSKLILVELGLFIFDVFDKYVVDGKVLSRFEIYDILL